MGKITEFATKAPQIMNSAAGRAFRKGATELPKGRIVRGREEAIYDNNMTYDDLLKFRIQNQLECIRNALEIGINQSTGKMDSAHEKYAYEFIENYGWKHKRFASKQNKDKKTYRIYSDKWESWMALKGGVPEDEFKYYIIMDFIMVEYEGKWIIQMKAINAFRDDPMK